MTIRLVCLDADDTLWHNETIFRDIRQRLFAILADHGDEARLSTRLAEVETRNLGLYGYGAKGFTLSMLEMALDLGDGCVSTADIAALLAAGREMMRHPIDPLPGVAEALPRLAALADLVLVTKGDLFHQEAKLAASGLGAYFSGVEIVSDKTVDTYTRIFARHGVDPGDAVMAGNSVRSDILPALAAGAWAALIPYPLVWDHEAGDAPVGHPRFVQCDDLGAFAAWIAPRCARRENGAPDHAGTP